MVNSVSNTNQLYSGPFPQDGKPTERLETIRKITTIGVLLGSGVLLSSLSILYPPLAVIGIGIIGLSLIVKYALNKIDKPVVSPEEKISTQLCVAAQKGYHLMVKVLLFFGANPNNTHNGKHSAALHHAIEGCSSSRYLSEIETLLNYGANPNQTKNSSSTSYTPLLAALDIKEDKLSSQILKILLKHGANPNPTERICPLYKAATQGKIESVKVLLDGGAKLDNIEFVAEETALFTAVNSARYEVVQLLINRGADKNAKRSDGKTLLDVIQGEKARVGAFPPNSIVDMTTRTRDQVLEALNNITQLVAPAAT